MNMIQGCERPAAVLALTVRGKNSLNDESNADKEENADNGEEICNEAEDLQQMRADTRIVKATINDDCEVR